MILAVGTNSSNQHSNSRYLVAVFSGVKVGNNDSIQASRVKELKLMHNVKRFN